MYYVCESALLASLVAVDSTNDAIFDEFEFVCFYKVMKISGVDDEFL